MPSAERIARLRLARTESVGPATFAYLMRRFGTAAQALEALPELARRGGRSGPLKLWTENAAIAELEAGEDLDAQLHFVGDTGFPPLLAALDPPPPLIWTRGDAAVLSTRTIAIVGARNASAAGQRFARGLAADLAEAGLTVVSGLARGVDGAAHHGALSHGFTIAVLAGGVDQVYPPEHEALYAAILAQGCVVSERPIGLEARAKDFPRRNRIISGLSLGVIVVEAELRSGSLITARLAGEQGRDVFAVPGSPLDPRARGANDLLRNGAILVETVEDVLGALSSAHRHLAEPDTPNLANPEPDEGEAWHETLFGLLTTTPAPIDEIARLAGAPVPRVMASLVELSLAGRVTLDSGGLVSRL
jgi:DNA processing protein